MERAAPHETTPLRKIRILSASYRASPGRRLLTGELSGPGPRNVPYARDVAPFVRALLQVALLQQQRENNKTTEALRGERDAPQTLTSTTRHTSSSSLPQSTIPLMDGKAMNAVFGDPCPGTSKQLEVHYVVYQEEAQDDDEMEPTNSSAITEDRNDATYCTATNDNAMDMEDTTAPWDATTTMKSTPSPRRRTKKAHIIRQVVHRATFSEHERVILKKECGIQVEDDNATTAHVISPPLRAAGNPNHPHSPFTRQLSEMLLPLLLPFLHVKERVTCRLVTQVWREIVQDYGVASTVDLSDPSLPRSRVFLRGILAHSYCSLERLFLNDFMDLQQEDLHPCLPHFMKLESLDISRCIQLDDATLSLIASSPLKNTLQVLYIKGLSRVTDNGLMELCHHCTHLRVLEISQVPITDAAARAIAKLHKLQALYMRDNYLLTNASIDEITEKCTQLTQLTLWGCTRLKYLSVCGASRRSSSSSIGGSSSPSLGCGNLVLLNLWGCHSLLDEAAQALGPMTNLRSLIVSECHRLTDAFLISLAEKVPQLTHLHLRYCKRITNVGIHAIANGMPEIYSMDLSFCTKITEASLVYLLETRSDTLAELRLFQCRQLSVFEPLRSNPGGAAGAAPIPAGSHAGRRLLTTLQSMPESNLCLLDVRGCGGTGGEPPHQRSTTEPMESDPFVEGMRLLQFDQVLPGFFSRPARWNPRVQERLVEQLLCSANAS